MKKLESYLIKTAETFLNKQHGEFYPFSAAQNISNEIQMIIPYSVNDTPESQFLIEQFRNFGQKKILERKIKRCGICYDVNLKYANEVKSAIQIEFLNYRRGKIETTKRTFLHEFSKGKYKINLPRCKHTKY